MDNHINQQLSVMQESATIALADRVRQLQAAGQKVIGLQTGDPDFNTPQPIMDAALRAMNAGQTHYVNSRGIPSLRRAIAERLKRENGLDYDPETEILVTSGGIHAAYCALQAAINPGDEVLVPDPVWMTHANMPRVMRGTVVRVPSSPEQNFWPTLDAWKSALTPRTVALVINSPNNPTGMIAPRDYLEQLNRFAAEHKLFVISFSKTFAMTGWRVGYLAAPAEVINQALKASQFSITNLAPFIQEAAAFALSSPEVEQMVGQMVTRYGQRRARVLQLYRDFGPTPIRLIEPQGAFYFFIDVRGLNKPSVEIAERLLNEKGVAIVPGSVYGACGEGFLRMTIAASDADVEAGFKAILDWAASAS